MLRYFFAIISVVLGILVMLYLVSPVEPVSWTPDATQELSGPFEKNERLAVAKTISIDGNGPEDLVFDLNGDLLTGLEDGRIIRLTAPDYTTQKTVVDTGGRPLSMRFDNKRNLIVADAKKGVLKYDFNEQKLKVLVDTYQGTKLKFVDHLDIAENGDIYFSDASARFGVENYVLDFIESSFTGRVFKFSTQTNQLSLVIDDLFFANGIALGPDDQYLLVNETGTAKIWKIPLKDNKSQSATTFISSLPGMPDNIFFDEKGTFWVGIVTLRDWRIEKLSSNSFLRKLIANLPASFLEKSTPYGIALGFDEDGQVVANLQTSTKIAGITAAIPFNDRLYFGFLSGSYIAYIDAPQTTSQ